MHAFQNFKEDMLASLMNLRGKMEKMTGTQGISYAKKELNSEDTLLDLRKHLAGMLITELTLTNKQMYDLLKVIFLAFYKAYDDEEMSAIEFGKFVVLASKQCEPLSLNSDYAQLLNIWRTEKYPDFAIVKSFTMMKPSLVDSDFEDSDDDL
jgi:hypothetical protein